MTAKLESQDIYFKLNDLMKNFQGTDANLKDKMEKFLND
jgi:hypothetical protein